MVVILFSKILHRAKRLETSEFHSLLSSLTFTSVRICYKLFINNKKQEGGGGEVSP